MIAFRLGRLQAFFSSLHLTVHPLRSLLFLFFLTSSFDLMHIYFVIFKIKMNNGIAFLLFLATFISRNIYLPKKLFLLTSVILAFMTISMLNSPNPIATEGFTLFFLFNFFCYFLVSYNQFRIFDSDTLLKIYFLSFFCLGVYAICQTLFSAVGIILPGVRQYIFNIARGEGFSYEPSYYALYMTPFAIYSTTKFILQHPSVRKIRDVIWPNIFLLVSTSTGCFFSYLFFLFFIVVFQYFGIFSFAKISVKKLFAKFALTFSALFGILWVTNKELITSGFLKFFYGKGIAHLSVQDRWRGIIEYWDVFLEHPLTGVGIGTGPFYTAQKKLDVPVDLLDPDIITYFSATNVTTEILASVGFFGGVCFLLFLFLLIDIFRSALRIKSLTTDERIVLVSFALSVCVMFMTLQFSQSIMRPYMWIHVGIFYGYAKYLKMKYSELISAK